MIRAIVLAAGKGTRMKSARSKVLHEICGRPMLWYVVRALRGAGIDEIVVVVNEELEGQIDRFDVASVLQAEQLGTGHAVQRRARSARAATREPDRRRLRRHAARYGRDLPRA